MDLREHKSATGHCQRAIDLMRKTGVPPVPRNYELFYAYATGRNKPLIAAMSRLLGENGAFSRPVIDELYETHLAPPDPDQTVVEFSDKAGDETGQLMALVREAIDATRAFGESLDEIGSRLDGASDPGQVKEVLARLVETTQQMGRSSIDLLGRLVDSERQIESLQGDLESARQAALTDPLTGIPNRESLGRILDREIARAEAEGRPLCLLMIDVDHFSTFNDRFGRQSGDSVLKLVARIVKAQLRESDHVARYDGEEFAAVLPGSDLQTALKVAERIRDSSKEKELVKRSTGEKLGRITLCIGVAHFAPGDRRQSLVERAGQCLLAAQRAGRNQVVSEPGPAAAPRGQAASA